MSINTTMAGSDKLGGSRIELLPDALASREGLLAMPDLIVSVTAPRNANAGQDISNAIRLIARNVGGAPAPGTLGAIDPANGYMIDLVLSRDRNVPARPAIFSVNFAEDALLRGGRTSRTFGLQPGGARLYPGQATIPADTLSGLYFLCARIDSGNRVPESDEINNSACIPIQVFGKNR
jgi:hypothetical protein